MSKDKPAAGADGWKPVLGLSDAPGERAELPVRAGTVFDQPEPEELIELTVIVPARNEEDCPVSYTHLDVYKRQMPVRAARR